MSRKKKQAPASSSLEVVDYGEQLSESGLPIRKGAEPFFYQRGKVGCLLCHGFTGAPKEFHALGKFLADKGITTIGPRLPGHGTTIEDLIKTNVADWYVEYSRVYEQLHAICDEIFVGGLSLGGLLSLKFASEHLIQGVISMATPIQMKLAHRVLLAVLTPFFKNFALPKKKEELAEYLVLDIVAYNKSPIAPANSVRKLVRETRKGLKKITSPVLILQGLLDDNWIKKGAKIIYDELSSEDKELIFLENSPHCLSAGPEKELVGEKIYQFIKKRSSLQ